MHVGPLLLWISNIQYAPLLAHESCNAMGSVVYPTSDLLTSIQKNSCLPYLQLKGAACWSFLLQVPARSWRSQWKKICASAVYAIKNSNDEDPVGYSTVLDSSVCNEGLVLQNPWFLSHGFLVKVSMKEKEKDLYKNSRIYSPQAQGNKAAN